MKIQFVDINGAKLKVVEHGGGTIAIVFLHYWGGTHRTYLPVIEQLSGDFRCVAFDQRGWGQSSREGDFSLAETASDTVALIQTLGLKKFVLVGHSRGGKVAQLVASQQPEGLQGLVLLAPATASPLSVPEETRETILQNYQTVEGAEFSLTVLTKKPLSKTLRQQVIEDTLGGVIGAKEDWMRNGMSADITELARKITVPTLVISGSEDVVDATSYLEAEIPKTIPHATFDVLPGLGHLAALEGPTEVAAAIRRFANTLR